MSDKDMISKAFASLKAPEDTLERIHETMKENDRRGIFRCRRAVLVLAALLVLALGTMGVYAAGGFQLDKIFGAASGQILDAEGNVVKEQSAGFVISAPFAAENPLTQVHHDGIDIIADKGTPVLAAARGKVLTAEFDAQRGNYVVIAHEGGYSTLYAHLAELLVEAGTLVETGDEIGTVGNTGLSTGPHLHLELHRDGQLLNPADYWEVQS